ncbi:ANFC protein, partial [Formicarius rufipectus]|nr:ANFC protein [Formicarius rufipectus]
LKLLFCPGFLLLLIVSQNQAGARSISSLQSLSELLDEELEPPPVPGERDAEREEPPPGGVSEQAEPALQWPQQGREQPQSVSPGGSAIQRFLSDLLSLSRRYRGRSKKGLSRGCFGVRLDRIGSLSGLGC